MPRTYQRYPFQSLPITGAFNQPYQFVATGRFAALLINFEGVATTVVGTVNPHLAQVMNILDQIEIYDNKSNTYMTLSGAAADYMFRHVEGVPAENVSLAGGVAAGVPFRHQIEIPFELTDGLEPQDTHLETFTKDVFVRLRGQNPIAAGVMFGTPSTMSIGNLTLTLSLKQYDMEAPVPGAAPSAGGVPPARAMREEIVPVTQTTDALRYELAKGMEFRGVTIVAEQLTNGVWSPDASVLAPQKNLLLRGTANNRIYQSDLVRNYRNETVQRRRTASVLAGIIDVPFIRNGRVGQSLVSDQSNQLFLEVPVVKQANDCRLRIITDALVSQVPGTR